jgi:hypothetical protein
MKENEGNLSERHKSYNLTQSLALFVIGLEVVFCGYLLLHADRFAEVHYVDLLFLITAMAAIFGILWRFCYNETYHQEVYRELKSYGRYMFFRKWGYRFFLVLTLFFLIGATYGGFLYIRNFKKAAMYFEIHSVKPPAKLNDTSASNKN